MGNKKILLLVLASALVIGSAVFFQRFESGGDWLWQISGEGVRLWPLVVISALVDSVNPCAFSILIVSIIFLFGLGKTRGRIFSLGMLYVLGIFSAYLLIGLGLLKVLHIFNVPHFMSKLGAAILILLGTINILESIFPRFPIKFALPQAAHEKMNRLVEKISMPAMFLLGGLVGLCEFPCTGGPYLTVVGLLYDSKTYWGGVGYLLAYNLIFVLPLILILSLSSNMVVVEKVRAFQKSSGRRMKIIAGFAMILLAYIVLIL